MIVLIAPENDLQNEIKILHQLFDAGLSHYHLRKPSKNEEELKQYLNQIDAKYYTKIVLHQFHHLVKKFNLKGIHLQEQFRIDLGDNLQEYIDNFKNQDIGIKNQEGTTKNNEPSTNNQELKTVSSSFHHPDTIQNCDVEFDYHLLSPIFNSISKQGYEGKDFSVKNMDKKIIGMGGVNAQNLDKIKAKGFQGAGVLGGVWNAEDPLQAFLELQENANF